MAANYPRNAFQRHPSNVLCRYFMNGACSKGASCTFSHDRAQRPSQVCRFYLRGKCHYGNNCRYDHSRLKADPPHQPAQTSSRGKRLPPYIEPAPEPEPDTMCDLCMEVKLYKMDEQRNKQHVKVCTEAHEKKMKHAFALQTSQEKLCGICLDKVLGPKEPLGSPQGASPQGASGGAAAADWRRPRQPRFGILLNCNHVFCFECIMKWRSSKHYAYKVVRSCPECRVVSEYVIQSELWVEDEDKDQFVKCHKDRRSKIHCHNFKRGQGMCKFGDECLYLHVYPDGRPASPQPRRRRRQNHLGLEQQTSALTLLEFIDEIQGAAPLEDLYDAIFGYHNDFGDDFDDDSSYDFYDDFYDEDEFGFDSDF